MSAADSLYTRVLDIWYNFLKTTYDDKVAKANADKTFAAAVLFRDDKPILDEAQQAEALKVLHSLCELRSQQREEKYNEYMKSLFCLGLLHYVLHDYDKSEDYAKGLLQDVAEQDSALSGEAPRTPAAPGDRGKALDYQKEVTAFIREITRERESTQLSLRRSNTGATS